jgi:hypothetical protein
MRGPFRQSMVAPDTLAYKVGFAAARDLRNLVPLLRRKNISDPPSICRHHEDS